MKTKLFLTCLSLLLLSCGANEKNANGVSSIADESQAKSLLGKELLSPAPSEKLLTDYKKHKSAYESDSLNVEKLIWVGRFAAYKGNYKEAISIYSKGIENFPDDPRLYRHRGHRYISIRKFDLAIKDLEHASKMIEGTENEIEPDGMPNAQNIPVSSLHGNIWYHLGLAYYLSQNMNSAFRAYKNCRASMNNADNLVSSTHWLYMILRRLDRNEEAERYLGAINSELNVIENTAYHKICLFYKGELSLEELAAKEGDSPGNDAIDYAIANWYFYNGELEKAKTAYEEILSRSSWNSFGYIAAESDFVSLFQ